MGVPLETPPKPLISKYASVQMVLYPGFYEFYFSRIARSKLRKNGVRLLGDLVHKSRGNLKLRNTAWRSLSVFT